MNLFQAIVLAVIQGVTELFPVSSLGHAVVIPHLFGWTIDQNATTFLPFLVLLHVFTALALLLYFWRDWWLLISSLFDRQVSPARDESRRLLLLLVLGTIPAGLVGLIFRGGLTTLFAEWRLVAVFLMLNGVMLALGEFLRRRAGRATLVLLRPLQAVGIGTSQIIALLPGFSRSGATLVGGLLVGLEHQSAARFSFLLATPIIFAAGLVEIPKLLQPDERAFLGPALLAGAISGVMAYLSTWFLMRYYKRQEVNALLPFAAYCILLGAATLIFGS
ncbi:MAG: undecaprenyl-diphosphate phosphatase [Chloroflexi bacterium]|nr:undecaprenyl-diphosphate phosphatase [Chloroflexota bacterium]MBV9598175.1 undecaprenyl-diphosphate phosphatase [Chloroflexota bacterium]